MNLLKGIAVTVAVLVVLIVINVICNTNGVELNSTVTGTTAAICAMFIYEKLTKKKSNE